MRQIDKIHLQYPFYGSREIRNELWTREYDIECDGVRNLMRRMEIEALYIESRVSISHPAHTIYPYLLRGFMIIPLNHVWAAEITQSILKLKLAIPYLAEEPKLLTG